jgi:hypothetical protein
MAMRAWHARASLFSALSFLLWGDDLNLSGARRLVGCTILVEVGTVCVVGVGHRQDGSSSSAGTVLSPPSSVSAAAAAAAPRRPAAPPAATQLASAAAQLAAPVAAPTTPAAFAVLAGRRGGHG